MIQLYLNNELCDLYGKEEIATDYSIAPISNISTRNSAKSITFKIPLTGNNREIIENNNVIVNSSTLPYTLIPARLEANGLDQKIEFAQLKSVKDNIELVLFGSNVDFFGIIKNRKLSDLGTQWNHVWNLINAHASLSNTSGYIYGMIDYHATYPNAFINNTDEEIDVRGLLTSVFLHSIITKIVQDAGFTASGNFLNDVDYKSVIIPCTENNAEYLVDETASFTALTTGARGIAIAQSPWTQGLIVKAGSRVTITNTTDPSEFIEAETTEDVEIVSTLHFVEFDNVISSNFITPLAVVLFQGFRIGDNYEIHIELILDNDNQDTDITADIGYTTSIISLTNVMVTQIIGRRFGSGFSPAKRLPDMKQSELIKDTAQKFNLIIQVDNANKIVHFRQFSEIIANIPNALDWSDKVDYMEKPEIQFDSDYGQRNLCTYTDDDTVIKPVGTDSEILINNQNLKPELKLFESPFAASEQVLRFGGISIAQIKIFTDLMGADEQINEVEPRYLAIRNEFFSPGFGLKDGVVTLSAGSVPMTHFISPDQDFNLGFANNLLDYSTDMIEMIQNFKLVKMLLKVNAADINQLDHFIPVWIEIKGQPGCYFYRSEIKQFKVGSAESTEVELGKLP